MKILVLHSRLSGYWMACMQAFVKEYDGHFTVIRQQPSPNAPFQFESTDTISLHSFEDFNKQEFKDFCKNVNPDLVYVSGWTKQTYLSVAKYYFDRNIPVLCGLDNQWKGTIKQYVGYPLLKHILSRRFTHLFIPGLYQFETARKLGFSKDKIITGLYSADVPLFSKVLKEESDKEFPRSFLFVGRLVERKGINELIMAFKKLKKETGTNWSLTIVGNGPLKEEIAQHEEIDLRDFVQPEELPDLMKAHGAFVLPSTIEPWGVVIHEAVAAGMPIVSNPQCGATTAFLRNGYNGFVTEAGNIDSLYKGMLQITQKTSCELYRMGRRSAELSLQYTPESWASTLYQLISNKKF